MFRFAPRQIARTVAFSQHQHVAAIGSTAASQALTARWLRAAASPGPKVRSYCVSLLFSNICQRCSFELHTQLRLNFIFYVIITACQP